MQAIIISADDLKRNISGYNPTQSNLVHLQSAKLADKLYTETVKTSDYKEVILMSGGGASGKTEFISEYLINKPVIILDGTLPSLEGAKIKVRLAQKYGKKVSIAAIWPEYFKVAYAAFLQRERKYPSKYFFKTHEASRKALLEIAKSDLNIEIKLYENAFVENGLIFYEYIFDNRQEQIEELADNQYTKEAIMKIVTDHN